MFETRGLQIPRDLAEIVDPRRCAFLVCDMQVGVLQQIADGDQMLGKLGEALEVARSAGMHVAFARHLSLPKPWMGVVQTPMAMAWQRTEDPEAVQPWFLPGSPATEIVPELALRPERPSLTNSPCLPLRARCWPSPCGTSGLCRWPSQAWLWRSGLSRRLDTRLTLGSSPSSCRTPAALDKPKLPSGPSRLCALQVMPS